MVLSLKKKRNTPVTSNETSTKVETKVTAATLASFLASVLVAILNGVNDYNLLAGLPAVVQTLLVLVIPALITFLGGYIAPHTNR